MSEPTPPICFHRKNGFPIPTSPSQPYHHMAQRPSPEIYKIMGRQAIRIMIYEFYQQLHESAIKDMFTRRSLDESVDRSAAYFVWLLGGPPEYQRQYGGPKLRARHLPFIISESSRRVWLTCFYNVLDHPQKFEFPQTYIAEFKQFLATFSLWMVNYHHQNSNP